MSFFSCQLSFSRYKLSINIFLFFILPHIFLSDSSNLRDDKKSPHHFSMQSKVQILFLVGVSTNKVFQYHFSLDFIVTLLSLVKWPVTCALHHTQTDTGWTSPGSPPSLLPGNPPDGRLARPHQLHTPPCKIHSYELENFFVNFYGETLGILQLYMQKCIINIFYCGDIVEILSMSMCFSFYLSQFDEKLAWPPVYTELQSSVSLWEIVCCLQAPSRSRAQEQ